MNMTTVHDNEAGISVTHWDDEHGSYPCYATLIESPDRITLVAGGGVHVYEPLSDADGGDHVEHLYAFLYGHTGSSFLADKIMSHLYSGHPPDRSLPPGQHFQVRFEGYFEFRLQTEDSDPRGLAMRITQGVLGELDAAADVWLDSYTEVPDEDEPEWPAFAIHTIHSRIEEVRA